MPFLVEIGSRRPNPSKTNDTYFRVVPFDRVTPTPSAASYFYRDEAPQKLIPAMTSARAGAVLSSGNVTVLGTAFSNGVFSPTLFTSDPLGGWKTLTLPVDGEPKAIGTKGDLLAAAVGTQMVISRTATNCSSTITSLAANGEDRGASFLVATEAGLRAFQPSTDTSVSSTCVAVLEEKGCMETHACFLVCPTGNTTCEAACLVTVTPNTPQAHNALKSCEVRTGCLTTGNCAQLCANETQRCQQTTNYRPTRAPSVLAWLTQRRSMAIGADNIVYMARLREAPQPNNLVISWPTDSTSRAVLPEGAVITSMLDMQSEYLLGTRNGLYRVPGSLQGALRLQTCSSTEILRDRPPPSEVSITSLARAGDGVLIGTSHGLATLSVLGSVACVAWLPTQLSTSSGTSVPVFPAGIPINDIVVGADRLFVLTEDQGLFHYDGDVP
jgi:hypothetical protein